MSFEVNKCLSSSIQINNKTTASANLAKKTAKPNIIFKNNYKVTTKTLSRVNTHLVK